MRTVALLLAALTLAVPALGHSKNEARTPIDITYLGNAGWQISVPLTVQEERT